jgi:hypothetical protein
MDSMQYVLAGSQQVKLTGTGANLVGSYGRSAAISADGNTIAIGAPLDGPGGDEYGVVYIYTRSGTTWTQQTRIVCGTAYAHMGVSVALSSNGNTLAAGADTDGSYGATYIYTRSGTTWTQQARLVGTGYISAPFGVGQGLGVALSADGNTMATCGGYDNGYIGATWIFTRSGTTWTQQGSKLVGSGATGTSLQSECALSADGNTLAVGGNWDNSFAGATWIFTRSGTTWSQQGSKLVGTSGVGAGQQGNKVSLSASGDTLAVGAFQDNSSFGAVWVFTRSGTTWSQQGSKLTPTGATGSTPRFGTSVSLSADGNVMVIGASTNNSSEGATWVFTRTNTTWSQQYTALFGSGGSPSSDNQGTAVAVSKDGNTFVTTGISASDNAWVFV